MPEDSKENKAKKLAAARKKLKEYQAKDRREADAVEVQTDRLVSQQSIDSDVASTVSEHVANDSPLPPSEMAIPDIMPAEEPQRVAEVERTYNFQTVQSSNVSTSSIDTIQILIAEKATLSSELNKFRHIYREKELENEELQAQFQMTARRLDELQKEFLSQQKTVEEFKSSNLSLQVQMQNIKSKYEDQGEHLEETKKLLAIEKDRNQSLRHELKDTGNELELTKIRINQLSDEASITKDNRVESLTQTQFMYEQQIRDLQAMVQQLTRDKEQANQQYQTYVQHLNTEVTSLNDKNSELAEECSKLQERERQFVEHISGLEKEIQKSITRQDQLKENQQAEVSQSYVKEIDDLKSKLSEFESERYEFQLKIKSQEDRLDNLNKSALEKDSKILELEEHIQNILSERPDSGKLLATMESDKIAASRALTQNDALKKQLDELELKFVQLTNDKADLVNKLDAEHYVNREIRNNFSSMEEQIKSLDEKLHFKDEEMIRLSHENNDLTRQILVLQQQLDRLQHYEAREYSEQYEEIAQDVSKENGNDEQDHGYHPQDDHNYSKENSHADHDHEHDHRDDSHAHDGHNHDHDGHDHGHNDEHSSEQHSECSSGHAGHGHSHSAGSSDRCDNHSSVPVSPQHHASAHHHLKYRAGEPPSIPTIEALQKLQSRFTKIMAQVADLTEEKQRLEHLVLQLQGETETIGEYIALYQTQRRILKQREYEKAAQLQLLLGEREEMREKISTLNKLVSNLGVELPNNLRLNESLTHAMQNVCIEPNVSPTASADGDEDPHQAVLDEAAMNKRLNSNESKEILVKIQSIITEIKENTKDIPPVNTADHLTCCSGKFEIV